MPRGAAAARTALEEEEEEEGEQGEGRAEEEGGAEDDDEGEGDERARQAFDPARLSCSASFLRDDDFDDEQEEGSRWSPDELFDLQHRSVEEPGAGEEGGGEGDAGGGRGHSSPSGARASRRPRRSSSSLSRSLSRSRCLVGEEPSCGDDDERLEDLIDSMLAMTVRMKEETRIAAWGREREREAKELF